ASRKVCCPSTTVSPADWSANSTGSSIRSTPIGSFSRPWLDSSSWILRATSSAIPASGWNAPRSVEMPARARADISTLRGAFHPDAGIADEVARKIHEELSNHGLENEPIGVDLIELPVLFALQSAGLTVVDGQQTFLDA